MFRLLQGQKQGTSHGCEGSSGHAIKVAAHNGRDRLALGKNCLHTNKGVTEATVGLKHFLGEVSIDLTA